MKALIFAITLIIALGIFIHSVRKLYKSLLLGKPENRFDRISERLKNVFVVALGQSKLLREPVAGLMHAFIFWGFCVLLIVVIESIIQGFVPSFSFNFLKGIYTLITFTQDLFGVLVLVGVLIAVLRRFVFKIKRLHSEKDGNLDAAFILTLITIVIVSMFGQNIHSPHWDIYSFRFFSDFLRESLEIKKSYINFEYFWWIHIVTILIFLNYLPYSKHLHVLTSIPNVFFAKLKPEKNTLKAINLEDETLTTFGALDVEHLTWKQLFDGYTCTECGRCTAACPANYTGKALSPRKIIMDVRQRLHDKIFYPVDQNIQAKTLIHNYISDEEIWACTTCNACVTECPVMIEHIDTIVDLRRGLVLTEANFPSELNVVFRNLETNFTPWAFSYTDRAQWAEGLDVKIASEDNSPELLFWVGCAGSFDERYKKVSRSIVKILKSAGIDFKILGSEEKCNGDAARRLGNEYLAQILMKENIQTLEKYGVKKILTTCPHCYHSIKNEYPQFGGNYEVIHHTELIEQLLKDGKIQLKGNEKKSLTYHDSCYLGRYNEIYNSPRETLKSINGIELKEMKRSFDKGFCCGAGGGRMFLEEKEGKRINIERTEEALSLNVDTIATACPFCMTMMTDGVKAKDAADNVQVKDIAEIVAESI
ncbi:MAG: (Fe-S)-binding protein [Ignavibacteria bacterium]|jgi:Fe-S oxidoreductase/nitrate reductase gamma subunit|nr:(Fe-S)-binding protein [Ignavibacteria bacterium]MDH7528466.1 (Fe-S)-binding protein [Ignavibacteria bacterium]